MPLKDWDIQINYGIKTGCNDAFIIDSIKRNEILDNCTTEEERQKTAEIIRPVPDNEDRFEMFVNEASSNPTAELDEIIDNMVFELYGLDQEEREYVINNYR